MREFGSDFHRCDRNFRGVLNYLDMMGDMRLYACGRHAIDAIIGQEKWNRIWMPAYFCYEVIGHIRSTGIEVMLYNDYPTCTNDDELVRELPYEKGDVLLRTDYYGFRNWRTNKEICVPVIEDHTHGLITDWALKSDADWCIASLRKTIPVAAGGILWSPKGKQLPDNIRPTEACEEMAKIRYEAMDMKAEYLNNDGDKEAFRVKYIKTEGCIDNLALSGIDAESEEITRALNIKLWMDLKYNNWLLAKKMLDKKLCILGKDREDYWQPFSLIFLLDSAEERESLRKYMIQHSIYPAVLWRIPEDSEFVEVKEFSERMLSVHCDIRYSRSAIEQMCKTINGFYGTNL